MSQELVDKVNILTEQTSELLAEYVAFKDTMNAKVQATYDSQGEAAASAASAVESAASAAAALASKIEAQGSASSALSSKNATAASEANALSYKTAARVSELAAAASELAAHGSELAAAASAAAAADSEDTAIQKAAEAAASAVEAAQTVANILARENEAEDSANQAAASATSADSSAGMASASATASANSASSALSSKNAAASSAAASANSATTASGHKDAAASSASSALSSKNAAAASQSAAAGSATAASNSAISAANSASDSAQSASEAADSAAQALANANLTFASGGYFEPKAGAEYPNVTGVNRDTIWLVKFPNADDVYTMTTGALSGSVIKNGYMLVYDVPQNVFDYIPTTISGVTQINGKSGDTVTLTAADVGALALGTRGVTTNTNYNITPSTVAWQDQTDVNTLTFPGWYKYLIRGDCPNAPPGDAADYWFIQTTEYGMASTLSYTQFALPYGGPNGKQPACYIRSIHHNDSEWTPWAMIYDERHKPTWQDVGAVHGGYARNYANDIATDRVSESGFFNVSKAMQGVSNTLPWGTHDWAYYFQAAHGNLAGYKGMLGMSFDGAAMGHAQLNDGVFTGWKRIYDDNYHPEANHAVEMGEDFEDAKSFHKAEVRYFSFHYGKVVIPLVPYLVEGKNSNKSYIEGKLVFHRGGASSSSRVEEVDLVAYQSYNQVVKAWMTAQYHDGWGWRLCTFDIQGKKWIGLYAPFNGNNQDARIAFTGRRHISNEAAANGFDRTQQLVAIEYEHLADPVSANNGIKNQEIYDTLAPYITIPAMQDGGGNKYYSENYKPTPAELGAVDETTVNKTGSTYEASISKIPYILANGCMEIARYVDFHLPGSTADYDARFAVNTAGKLTQHHATEVADVAQSSHSYSDLSNGAGGGKNYTRRLRGGTGDTIFHETVQSSTYRLATGNEDTIDLLRLIASPDPTQVQGYIGNQRIMTSNYGVFTGAVSAVDLQSWSSGRRGFKLTSTNATYAEMAPIGADSTILWTEALRWYGADDWRIGSSKRIYHQGFKPTASDIGAGTFLGDVWTKQGASWRTSASSIGSSATGLLCYAPDKTTIVGGAGILSMDGVATSSFLGWGTTPWSLANSLTVNANSFTYKGNAVYHAGNKPTATDVGAAKGFRNLRSPSSGVSEWHRIAISPGGNWGSALFTVKAEKSGIHTTVNFTVTTVFNKNPKITLLGCSHYLTAGITEIAVEYKDGDPYADMYVLIKATANNIEYEVANNIGFVDSWVPATALGRDTIVMNVSAADKSIDTAGGKVYSNGVEVYSPLNKPTTGDIGALPLQMNQYGLSSLGLTDADFSGLTLPQAFDRIGNAMLASAAGTAREKVFTIDAAAYPNLNTLSPETYTVWDLRLHGTNFLHATAHHRGATQKWWTAMRQINFGGGEQWYQGYDEGHKPTKLELGIHVSSFEPTPAEGQDGDIWFMYE